MISLFAIDVDALYQHYKTDHMLKVLSEDEKQRASRFRFDQLRDRFISGRFFLRKVLEGLVGVQADLIRFELGNNGKPAIDRSQCPDAHFSFSRSEQFSACCFSDQRRVGIDLELLNKARELDQIAGQVFSKIELEHWRSIPTAQQSAVFYQAWTRKEAVSKVDGRGITHGMAGIKVPLDRLDQFKAFVISEAIKQNDTDAEIENSIALSDWQPFDDVMASVAIEVSSPNGNELEFNDEQGPDFFPEIDLPSESVQRSFA